MSNGADRPPSRPQRPVQWVILLAAAAIVAYLCLLILLPFLNVLAWSSVLAIAFHPVHSRLAAKIGRPSLSAFLSSLLVVVMIFIPLLLLSGLAVNQFLALRSYLQENFKEGFDVSAIGPLRRVYEWLATRLGDDLLDAVIVTRLASTNAATTSKGSPPTAAWCCAARAIAASTSAPPTNTPPRRNSSSSSGLRSA